MERDPKFEEHLDGKALERFGPQTVQVMRRNRENAHAGDYTEAIAAHCRRLGIEPSDLSQEDKTSLVLDNIEEQAHALGVEDEAEDSMQRYEHAEKAYELLNEAHRELGLAGYFDLASKAEAIIEGLFIDAADEHGARRVSR